WRHRGERRRVRRPGHREPARGPHARPRRSSPRSPGRRGRPDLRRGGDRDRDGSGRYVLPELRPGPRRPDAVTVVAVDGPAGAGKSTVTRALAERLGFTYLDSGAMYRSVGLAALERGLDPAAVAASVRIDLGDRVSIDGVDVTEAIRRPEISEAASRAAADPRVREAMIAEQRRLLSRGDWVAEGRDIGTVVAPDAALT